MIQSNGRLGAPMSIVFGIAFELRTGGGWNKASALLDAAIVFNNKGRQPCMHSPPGCLTFLISLRPLPRSGKQATFYEIGKE
jgi:hypothetical protein